MNSRPRFGGPLFHICTPSLSIYISEILPIPLSWTREALVVVLVVLVVEEDNRVLWPIMTINKQTSATEKFFFLTTRNRGLGAMISYFVPPIDSLSSFRAHRYDRKKIALSFYVRAINLQRNLRTRGIIASFKHQRFLSPFHLSQSQLPPPLLLILFFFSFQKTISERHRISPLLSLFSSLTPYNPI